MTARTLFHREILEQPEVVERLLREGRPRVAEAAALLAASSPQWIMIGARGSSDNAARYAQYVLGARNRLAVALAAPSLFTRYAAAPRLKGAVVLAISQSGQGPDLLALLQAAHQQSAPTISITNHASSPLSAAADVAIPLMAGEERAVAASKTYMAELCAVAMLSALLADDAKAWDELLRLPEWLQATLDDTEARLDGGVPLRSAEQFVVLGRGFNYATAHELALKLKETTYRIAAPYSFADLLHGPVAMLDRGFATVLIAPSGLVLGDAEELLSRLRAIGVDVLLISDAPSLHAAAGGGLHLPQGVPEWLSPFCAIAAGQLWANQVALAMGRNPDEPRGLTKVTRTS